MSFADAKRYERYENPQSNKLLRGTPARVMIALQDMSACGTFAKLIS